MRWSFSIGQVYGIQIRIHATFFLLLAAFAYYLIVPAHPLNFWPLALTFAVFLCVALHELAHGLTAEAFGARVDSVTLLPIGGVAVMRGAPSGVIKELLVALSGPAVNAVIAGVIYLAAGPFQWPRAMYGNQMQLANLRDLFVILGPVNLAIALFNLLPAFPMDGGRALRGLVGIKLPLARATQFAAALGEAAAVALVLLGFHYGIIWLAIGGIFLLIGAASEEMTAEVGAVFDAMTLKHIARTSFETLREDDPLVAALDALCRSGQTVFPVTGREGRFLGAIERHRLLDAVKRHGTRYPAGAIVEHNAPAAGPDDTIANAFAAMNRHHLDGLAILDDDRLVGIATRDDILRAFHVNRAIQQAPNHHPHSLATLQPNANDARR